LDKPHPVLRRQSRDVCHKQSWGNNADYRRDNVLEAERDSLRCGRLPIKIEQRGT